MISADADCVNAYLATLFSNERTFNQCYCRLLATVHYACDTVIQKFQPVQNLSYGIKKIKKGTFSFLARHITFSESISELSVQISILR